MMLKVANFSCLFVCLLFFFAGVCCAETGPRSGEIFSILSRLEADMKDISSIQTDFVQQKRLTILNRDLELRGTVCIEKPMSFAWHVNTPLRYSLVVKDDQILQWDDSTQKVQKMSMGKHPVLRMVFAQMEGWMTGAYVAMIDEYDIRKLDGKQLTLVFVPVENNISFGLIESVVITFMDDTRYIKTIEIAEKSGDQSTFVFSNTVLNGDVDAQLWEVCSGV